MLPTPQTAPDFLPLMQPDAAKLLMMVASSVKSLSQVRFFGPFLIPEQHYMLPFAANKNSQQQNQTGLKD